MTSFLRPSLLFGAVVPAVMVCLVFEPRHQGLNSNGYLILLITAVCAIAAAVAALIWRMRITGETKVPAAGRVDDPEQKRQRLKIRIGKIAILILALQLLNVLRLMREGPIFPLAVGAAMGLLIIVAIAISIRNMQKSLR